jgi:NADH:ubiquinone oxidoreductase subunit E
MSSPTSHPPAKPPAKAGRGGKRAKVRSTPKGRTVDPKALEDVRALLGDAPRRRDLLIEHLHKIQDRYHCLSAPHLVALAAEMKLAMTEVYEVATFYHHFDVVKEGDTAPPPITVRVCDSIACELAGSHDLLEKLPSLLGSGIRVLHAPCVGRCETAPVAVVGQNPIPHATTEQVVAVVQQGHVTHPRADEAAMHPHFNVVTPGHSYRLQGVPRSRRVRAGGGVRCGESKARRRHRVDGRLRPSRPRRRGISRRPKVEARFSRAGSPVNGDQHRRR